MNPATPARVNLIGRLLARLNLRFPGLFALLAAVLVADLVVPDPIPFADEIVLALLTAIFGLWKSRRPPVMPPQPPPAGPGGTSQLPPS